MSSSGDYVYQNDPLGYTCIGLLVVFGLLAPLGYWFSILVPFWRVGGLAGWMAKGGLGSREKEAVASAARKRPALLSFKNVRYSVMLPGREGGNALHVLKGVSGVLRPGTLTAIMGPSGCGKSTLLDVLADTKSVGRIHADIRLNGEPRDDLYRQTCAYVMQDDCQYTTLTVREALWFTCALRLPASTPRADRIKRIDETLADLSLTPFADTRIGDDVSGGLSGGQRRRVTIAVELLSRPQLIFLDEPTSGLDAYGAQQVCLSLRKFAERGGTLAATIHQPRAETFALFHQLLLIKSGETMCGRDHISDY